MVVHLGTSQNLYKWQISWIFNFRIASASSSRSGAPPAANPSLVSEQRETNLFVEQLLHDRIILACSLAVHEN